MKKTRKFLAILLAGSIAAGCLIGCGKTESNPGNATAVTESAGKVESSTTVTEETEQKGPITTEPITISILTRRHNATNDAKDIWFFKYLEYWLSEQGYNITLDVQQTAEADQQIPLMLGTDSLPDLIWGCGLGTSNAVTYGAEEGMLLDWTPYLNEKNMPNLYALLQEEPDALTASICNDGKIYSVPYLSGRDWGDAKLNMSMNHRVYVDTTWMEECNVEMPANLDEFLDMLRAFKNKKLESGESVTPLVSNADFFQKMLWANLGHYGNEGSAYGTVFTIKDGKVVFPAYTEDYRTVIEIMKTCYDEGLISQDFFTMDKTTARGLMTAGVCGVACDWTMGYVNNFENYVSLAPFAIDDNEVAMSLDSVYRTGYMWANADTEYPEVLALIVDYLYSDEGSLYYFYGPMEGQDPLEMLDGWYFDEEGNVTTKLVADGTYESFGTYVQQYVYSYMYVGTDKNVTETARKMAGIESTTEEYTITDALTGETVIGQKKQEYTHDNADGHWRLTAMDAQEKHMTVLRLPDVYLTEEDSVRSAELKKVIGDYVKAESAKFITGSRPISEIDTFFEELKKLDVEEYIAIYENAYSTYMDANY